MTEGLGDLADMAVKANEDRFELGSGHQCTGSAMLIYQFAI